MISSQKKMREWIVLAKGDDILTITSQQRGLLEVQYRDNTSQRIAMVNGAVLYDYDTGEIIITIEQVRYLYKQRRLEAREKNERQNKSIGKAQISRDYR